LLAWLTLLPVIGPLPVNSHTRDMAHPRHWLQKSELSQI
jgi:hypothetical protein